MTGIVVHVSAIDNAGAQTGIVTETVARLVNSLALSVKYSLAPAPCLR